MRICRAPKNVWSIMFFVLELFYFVVFTWVTLKIVRHLGVVFIEQARDSSSLFFLRFFTPHLPSWARDLGLNYTTFYRISKIPPRRSQKMLSLFCFCAFLLKIFESVLFFKVYACSMHAQSLNASMNVQRAHDFRRFMKNWSENLIFKKYIAMDDQ